MKVAVICIAPGFGGLELYAEKVARYYQSRNVFAFFVGLQGAFLQERIQNDKLSARFVNPINVSFPILTAWRLAKWLESENVDIMHIHSRFDLPLASIAKKLSRRRVAIVYTRQMALTRPKRDPWHRFQYRQVDRLLTITKKLRNEAIAFLPMSSKNIHVLYYGVPEPEYVNRNLCAKLPGWKKAETNDFRVAIFGRIKPEKGQYLLIEALSHLSRRGIKVNAWMVGRPMDAKYIERLHEKVQQYNLQEQVLFVDFIKDPQNLMPCFNAIILASHNETFGLVLAEAMRSRVAVIGSNSGGVTEIIEDGKTGLLFESGNSKALADCIEKLWRDRDFLDQLAIQGKHFADRNFSDESHLENLTMHLESVMQENR